MAKKKKAKKKAAKAAKVPTVDTIAALADEGLSPAQVASRLNGDGYVTARGGSWYDTTVVSQLRAIASNLQKRWPHFATSAAAADATTAARKAAKKAKKAKKAAAPAAEATAPTTAKTVPHVLLTVSATDGGNAGLVQTFATFQQAVAALLALKPATDATLLRAVLPLGQLPDALARHDVQSLTQYTVQS